MEGTSSRDPNGLIDLRMRNPEGEIFSRWASSAARTLGSAKAFAIAVGIVVVWALTGPFFDFSDTWQLIINTGTTIVTFLMVFLIQNTQNRDSGAVQLKLDEILRSTKGAHNAMLDLEGLSTEDLDKIRALYQELAEKARADELQGRAARDTPDITLPERDPPVLRPKRNMK